MGTNIGKLFPREKIPISVLSGKTVAIDGLFFMYQFLSSIRQRDGSLLKDSKGRVTSHLSGFFYRTIYLLENGIKPVYIFDGEPPSFKKKELEKRKQMKQEAEKKLLETMEKGNYEEMRKYAKRTSRVVNYMIEDTKKLLEYMGIPYIVAKTEGEAQASYLVTTGKVWCVVSSDYDSILFGAQRLVRGLAKESDEVEYIELEKVLKELSLTRVQLIVAGILAGCDYTPDGFEGIGPKKALEIAKSYKFDKDIDFDKVERYVRWKYPYTLKELVDFYLHPEVYTDVKIEFKKPDNEKIIEFLCEEHDFSRERVEKAIEKLEKSFTNTLSQSSLLDFF